MALTYQEHVRKCPIIDAVNVPCKCSDADDLHHQRMRLKTGKDSKFSTGFNLLKPTGYVVHHPFNIQQL